MIFKYFCPLSIPLFCIVKIRSVSEYNICDLLLQPLSHYIGHKIAVATFRINIATNIVIITNTLFLIFFHVHLPFTNLYLYNIS